jgi:hypothetical protein
VTNARVDDLLCHPRHAHRACGKFESTAPCSSSGKAIISNFCLPIAKPEYVQKLQNHNTQPAMASSREHLICTMLCLGLRDEGFEISFVYYHCIRLVRRCKVCFETALQGVSKCGSIE